MEKALVVVDGRFPEPFVSLLREGSTIEAMASEEFAAGFGVQVDDTYSLRTDNGQIPITIAGLWRPADPLAPYWDVRDN